MLHKKTFLIPKCPCWSGPVCMYPLTVLHPSPFLTNRLPFNPFEPHFVTDFSTFGRTKLCSIHFYLILYSFDHLLHLPFHRYISNLYHIDLIQSPLEGQTSSSPERESIRRPYSPSQPSLDYRAGWRSELVNNFISTYQHLYTPRSAYPADYFRSVNSRRQEKASQERVRSPES